MKSKILGFTAILFAVTLAFAFKPFVAPCPDGSKFVVYNGTGSITAPSSYTSFSGPNYPCIANPHLCGFCVPNNSTYFNVNGTLKAIPGSEATINIQAELNYFSLNGYIANDSHEADLKFRETVQPPL